MFTIQEVIEKIKTVIRRRKKLLIIIPIFFLCISIAALYVIEPKYQSSISILVEQDKESILDLYNINQSFRPTEPLNSFNKIIYSRSAMEMLIDSLRLGDSVKTIAQKDALIGALRSSISTAAERANAYEVATSFDIVFTSTDPVMARDAVELLAQFYMNTRSRFESKQSSETVEFLTLKLAEIEQIIDEEQEDIVSSTTEQIQQIGANPEVMQNRLESINTRLQETSMAVYQEETKVEILEEFLNQPEESFSMEQLYRLSLSEVPNGESLVGLLNEYDALSQQYTESYPGLRNTREQIIEVARRILPAVRSSLQNLIRQQEDLEMERRQIIQDLERSYIATQSKTDDESNYTIYQDLYGAIKKKLEQARINREMGNQAAVQFNVLDRPQISETPVSPNKRLVLGAGLGLGLFISCILIGFAEVMDTTIRSEEDLKKFNKPVIAYLKDGRE